MESALMNRIVFGCGRLTGGASEREALALVHQCLDAGCTFSIPRLPMAWARRKAWWARR
jgi:predicted oxidoreductase